MSRLDGFATNVCARVEAGETEHGIMAGQRACKLISAIDASICQITYPPSYLPSPLSTGHSVLVAAHTSAGKTVVAEYAFAMALRYTAGIMKVDGTMFLCGLY